jgi:hypothetical protein
MWHSTPNYHTIYPTTKWSCQESEQNVDGQGKEHAKWCWPCTRIMGECSGYAKYLLNMSPSSALVDTTPHEVWLGKKPSVSHLKVFFCDAFVHVPKEKRSKLDNKAVKCIFIRYKEGMKGYKLWDQGKQCTVEMWSSEKLEVSLRLRKFFRPRIILRCCGLN